MNIRASRQSLLRLIAVSVQLVILSACSSSTAATPRAAASQSQPPIVDIPLNIPSDGAQLRSTMYLADGAGPHPTVLLMHGFPGSARMDWLARPMRDAGFNVLFIHPRGMWQSEGEFTLPNALRDANGAIEFLRTAGARSELRVDAERIILVGHSFGGWIALRTAASQPAVQCVAGLTPANLGRFGEQWRTDAALRSAWTAGLRRATSGPNAPVRTRFTAEELIQYVMDNAEAEDLRRVVPSLHARRVLLLGARDDGETPLAEHHLPLLEALQKTGTAQLTEVVLPTDHAFTKRRDLLTSILISWLEHDCLASAG